MFARTSSTESDRSCKAFVVNQPGKRFDMAQADVKFKGLSIALLDIDPENALKNCIKYKRQTFPPKLL